jgi:hypothetical protein
MDPGSRRIRQLAALGLRFNGAAFTSIPTSGRYLSVDVVLAHAGSGRVVVLGDMPHDLELIA